MLILYLYFQSTICGELCNNKCSQIYKSNVIFRRTLNSEIDISEEKYGKLKERIFNILDESDDAFAERLKGLEHDDLFRKRFKELIVRDISEQKLNHSLQHKKIQKHDAFNYEHNLKKKYHPLKHYNSAEKYKNVPKFSKTVNSQIEIDTFPKSSKKKRYAVKHPGIAEQLLQFTKKHKILSSLLFIVILKAIVFILVSIIMSIFSMSYVPLQSQVIVVLVPIVSDVAI
ncbi:Plasmodium exported protein, unknown function [Plasmodium malariae]|uniref:Pv-fam-d protein n=1 Tax=Plasmodium malariae TaxID=5858 RepID=A0A1A8WIA7_PLAMA|nr:Plasmodium exported protein, unknown function [Plasmodium malariae]